MAAMGTTQSAIAKLRAAEILMPPRKFAPLKWDMHPHVPNFESRDLRETHRLTVELVRNEKPEIFDERIDLAQVFAPAFLGLQLPFAHVDH